MGKHENPYESPLAEFEPAAAAEPGPWFYWGPNSIPELAGLSRQQQRTVLRRRQWKAFRHWQVYAAWAGLTGFMLAPVVGLRLLGVHPNTVQLLLGGAALGGFGGLLFGQVSVRCMRPYLAEEVDRLLGIGKSQAAALH